MIYVVSAPFAGSRLVIDSLSRCTIPVHALDPSSILAAREADGEARFVYVHRDPVVHMRRMLAAYRRRGVDGPWVAETWAHVTTQILDELQAGNDWVAVSYESMLTTPGAELERLCDLLGTRMIRPLSRRRVSEARASDRVSVLHASDVDAYAQHVESVMARAGALVAVRPQSRPPRQLDGGFTAAPGQV